MIIFLPKLVRYEYKMMEIIKGLKCCQNLYQVVVCPWPGAMYMFEIVKKCKISLPARTR